MLTPDGVRYLAAARQRVARPFHLRFALPLLLGDEPRRWVWCTRISMAAIAVLCAIYAKSPWMACVVLLPGMRFNLRRPVLVDSTAMALALGAAVAWPHSWILAVALALMAGCVRETAPVWAAIYCWNPLLLVGLIPVAIRALQRAGDDVLDGENAWILQHPIKASRKYHKGMWLDPRVMITPWGGMLAGLAAIDLHLGAALAAGYAQLLVATDSVRLYQWAAPVLAAATVHALPQWALPIVALSLLVNPWRGTGG